MGEQIYPFMDVSMIARAEANRGKQMKVFDWDKAARLIKERKPKIAEAGLEGDWEYTGGVIYRNGKPVTDNDIGDSYTYLASTWATPILELDGDPVECYVMDDKRGWDEHTKWPKSALEILKK